MNMFQLVACINDWVFQTVPCSSKPYTDRVIQRMELPKAIACLYAGFKEGRLTGWCSLNAEFMKMVLEYVGFECRMFNYGLRGKFTHATSVVKINEDEYLFDPYFNRYYAINGQPISFDKLMHLINDNNTSEIRSVYGHSLKYKEMKPGDWGYVSGEWFDNIILNGFRRKINLDREIIKEFGSPDPFNLMKINWG